MTTTAMPGAALETPLPVASPGRLRVLGFLLRRDILVAGRELLPFLAQTVVQPFFTLFVFGAVLPRVGFVDGNGFAAVLLPGVVAVTALLGGLQSTTMPLVMDFSWGREIEDRLLAPVPIAVVAVEKMLFGALRGILSALLMVPIGLLMLPVSWAWSAVPGLLLVVVLGALTGASLGMVLGTHVPPRQITVMFAVILTPVMFTGAVQFPVLSLGSSLWWYRVVCTVNPLTYASESLRAFVVPGVPHVPLWLGLPVLVATIAVFGGIGIRGFLRRAVD